MKEYIIISDLHAGSRYSVTNNPRNNIQRAIRKIWNGMIADLETRTIAGGINLGDSTEGTDYHGQGKENDCNDKLWQINLAKDLIDEIPCNKWFGVSGSGYHVGRNLCDDEILADKLGASFGNELVVKVEDARIHCAHKIGVSTISAYRTTAIAREMMIATLNENEYGKFNAILRGHTHYFCSVRFGGSMGVICPCWKGRDSFAQTLSLSLMPHLGYCILKVEGKRVELEPHIYTLKGNDLIREVKG